jgi:hypothetical protein
MGGQLFAAHGLMLPPQAVSLRSARDRAACKPMYTSQRGILRGTTASFGDIAVERLSVQSRSDRNGGTTGEAVLIPWLAHKRVMK